jgi:FkbM family methyltransferase
VDGPSGLQRAGAAIRVARRYQRHFGFTKGLKYAISDRPGASGTMTVEYGDYPPLVVRRGDTDLRTLCHVLGSSGYEAPWPATNDPKWIIDAGANTGMAAVYYAHNFPKASVIAIEPDPGNFELLETNTAHFSNVSCIRAALWSHTGTVDLVDPGDGSWAFRVEEAPTDAPSTNLVQAITVDSLVERYDIERVDVLKVDIEGGERAVFEDAAPWIDRVDTIAIELHDRFQPGCSEAFDRATAAFTRRATRGEDTFVARSA